MENWPGEEVVLAKSSFLSGSHGRSGPLNKPTCIPEVSHSSFLQYGETPNFMYRGLFTKGNHFVAV